MHMTLKYTWCKPGCWTYVRHELTQALLKCNVAGAGS